VFTHKSSQIVSKSTYIADLLVVEKPVYARIAKTYAEIVRAEDWKFGQTIAMKNTAFVKWGVYRINEEDDY